MTGDFPQAHSYSPPSLISRNPSATMTPAFRHAAASRRLLALIAALPLSLPAQTTWTGNIDNDWAGDANWDPAVAPTSADTVYVNNGGSVSITTSASAADLHVGYDDGLDDGDDSGAATVNTGGTLVLAGNLYLGCGCVPGAFTVQGGGGGSSNGIFINTDSTFTLTGSGSTWTTTGSVNTTGTGTSLYVQAGATLSIGDGIRLGASGNDAITIDSGGVLTVTNSSELGYNEGFTSTATVTGLHSRWDTGDLSVGTFGQGSLSISSGAVVNTVNAAIAYGSAGGPGSAVGTVTVSGSADDGGTPVYSAWNVSGSLGIGGYLDEDQYNSGALTISDGGVVTVGGGTGTVTIETNGTLNIGSGGAAGVLDAAEVAFTNAPASGDSATPATLVFNHTGDITFTPVISGGGQVIKQGAGATTLTGASTYSGPTEVNGGTLVIDNTGDWEGSDDFQVNGSGSTLRIGAASTVAADLTVTDGTVEVAGKLDLGPTYSTFTDGTLRVLGGGEILDADIDFEGGSQLVLNGAGAITDGSFYFYDSSTLVASTPGAITGGTFTFLGNRTVTLPDAGVIANGDIELGEDVSTNLDRAGLIKSTFDEDGFPLTEIYLDLYDNSHATISVAGAVDTSLISLWDHSTLSITAAGGITQGGLGIADDAVATLEVDNALDGTSVMVADNGTLVLNGHATTIVGLLGDGRIVNNSATPATLTLDTATECGCGSTSLFAGTLADGAGGGALALTVTGNGALYIGGPQTYSGPTNVVGAALIVVNDGLTFNGSISSPITLSGGATLAGTGTVGNVTIVSGGATSALLSPGDDFAGMVGTLTTGNLTLAGQAGLEIDLADATAGAGIGSDILHVNGDLTFSATPGDTLTIFLRSGDGLLSSTFTNFDANASGGWTLASVSGSIVNYVPGNILIDTSLFGDAFSGAWSTALGNGGHDLNLVYTAIPEPSALAALGAAAAFASVAVRRRRHAA